MRRITSALLLLALLLTGCGGVSKEEYDAVVRERDALLAELQELQAQEAVPSTVLVKVKGDFTATVRALIPDYCLDDTSPQVAVVTLFQSTPFALYVGDLGEDLEVGETYVFEIKEAAVEIPLEEYEHNFPDPEVILPQYNLRLSGFREAKESDYGLDAVHLVYEAYELDVRKGWETADE